MSNVVKLFRIRQRSNSNFITSLPISSSVGWFLLAVLTIRGFVSRRPTDNNIYGQNWDRQNIYSVIFKLNFIKSSVRFPLRLRAVIRFLLRYITTFLIIPLVLECSSKLRLHTSSGFDRGPFWSAVLLVRCKPTMVGVNCRLAKLWTKLADLVTFYPRDGIQNSWC